MSNTPNTHAINVTPVLRFRSPTAEDAQAIRQLIRQCPPLDVNSCYAYLLQSVHLQDTCVVAEAGRHIVGYVSAYHPPKSPDTLFVWQVAVAPAWRGRRLAQQMIQNLLDRRSCLHVRQLETTVSPGNHASENLFRSLARQYQARCDIEQFFGNDLFDDPSHAPERLFRISPLRPALAHKAASVNAIERAV